jgi:hypothetical protein
MIAIGHMIEQIRSSSCFLVHVSSSDAPTRLTRSPTLLLSG